MKHFRRLAQDIDVAPLLRAITEPMWSYDLYWKNHPIPVFRDVDSILLRFPQKVPYTVATEAQRQHLMRTIDPWECFDQPCFDELPAVRELVFQIMTRVSAERLGRVMINRLPPGKHIPAHSDIVRELKYYDRLHVVLQTNGAVDFRAGEETVQMQAGELWWFDNAAEHEVWNRGAGDRLHLIVDVRVKKGMFQ